MTKLTVFKYHQAMMSVLGIYPRPRNASSRLSWSHSICPYFVILTMSLANTLSTTYVYQGYNTIRLSYVFESFALVIGGLEAVCAYINMRWKMEKTGDVQAKLQEIADQCNISIFIWDVESVEATNKLFFSLCIFIDQPKNTMSSTIYTGLLRENVVNSPKTWLYLCCSNKLHS